MFLGTYLSEQSAFDGFFTWFDSLKPKYRRHLELTYFEDGYERLEKCFKKTNTIQELQETICQFAYEFGCESIHLHLKQHKINEVLNIDNSFKKTYQLAVLE